MSSTLTPLDMGDRSPKVGEYFVAIIRGMMIERLVVMQLSKAATESEPGEFFVGLSTTQLDGKTVKQYRRVARDMNRIGDAVQAAQEAPGRAEATDPGQAVAERYPLCGDQIAQIDCRISDCIFHQDGACRNVSPAITLNPGGASVCWSRVDAPGASQEGSGAAEDTAPV